MTNATLTLEDACAIVDAIDCWIGWEMWECGRKSIRIDGELTPRDLEALAVVLKEQAAQALQAFSYKT